MNSDKTSEKRYTLDDLLKAIDFDKLMAESYPKIETEAEYVERISGRVLTDVSPKRRHVRVSLIGDLPDIDHSDFGINYKMIRPPTKRIEEA